MVGCQLNMVVIISGCYKDIYVRTFFPLTNSYTLEFFEIYRTLQLLPCEVLLYLHKSTTLSCIEYCCHVWAGAPSCYLEMLNQLQKWVFRTTLAHHRNVGRLSLFHRYYFAPCSYERLNWLYYLILMEDRLVILIECMNFLSPFLDVIRISMSAVSGLVLL